MGLRLLKEGNFVLTGAESLQVPLGGAGRFNSVYTYEKRHFEFVVAVDDGDMLAPAVIGDNLAVDGGFGITIELRKGNGRCGFECQGRAEFGGSMVSLEVFITEGANAGSILLGHIVYDLVGDYFCLGDLMFQVQLTYQGYCQ